MRDTSSPASNTSRLINLYREPVGDGGKTKYIMRAVMGMEPREELGGVFTRDMFAYDGSVITIVAGSAYKVDPVGFITIGPVDAGLTGNISRNGKIVTIVSGGKYYAWDPDTLALTEPAAGPITDLASVDFLAGRTILGEAGGNRFCWSDIADPYTLNGLNFASAEQRDDNLVRLMVSNGMITLFGEKSTELWAPTGAGGAAAFALLGGSVIDRGLKDFALACRVEGGIFLVANDGIAYVVGGNAWQAVSSPAVNTAIKEGDPASCLTWSDRGHKFAAIIFRDRPAWVYDFATTEWHERAEGQGGAWTVRASAEMAGSWIVGAENGSVYTLTNAPQDLGGPLWRQATSFPVFNGGNWFTVAAAELFLGNGYQAGAANIMLEVGRGETFSGAQIKPIGGAGDFGKRAKFYGLGRHQTMAARLTITDPYDIPLYSDAEVRIV